MVNAATTVGSITGELKLDISDWVRKIDDAKAKAHEIEGGRATLELDANTDRVDRALDRVEADVAEIEARPARVRVTAETSEATLALATVKDKVDTVAAAEAKLAAAQSLWERTTNQATLAEMRLEEVRGRRRSTALQVAAAEEAYRFSEERATTASEKLTAAEGALTLARQEGAAAAEEESTANSAAAGAASSAASSNNLLAQSVMGLGPALVPLSSGAVSVVGALTGITTAGVLAFAGIKREMANATAEGLAYSAMVDDLRSDVEELEGTAAAGVLGGANSAAGELQQAMPLLNQEIGVFSDELGQILPTGLDAVLTMLERAEPLLDASGQYLVNFVDGLDGFSHSSQFESFVQYALQNLPLVEHTIEDALTFVDRFLTAMGPYGSAVLDLVDGALKLGTVLAPIAPEVWGVVTALMAMSAGGRIIDSLTAGMARLGLTSTATAGEVAAADAAAGAGAAGAGGAAAGAAGIGGALLGSAAVAGAALVGSYAIGDVANTGQKMLGVTANGPAKTVAATQRIEEQTIGTTAAAGGAQHVAGTPAWVRQLTNGPVGDLAAVGGDNAGVQASRNWDALDQSFANLAQNGHAAKAAQMVQGLAAAEHLSEAQTKDLLPTYSALTASQIRQATSLVTVADAYLALTNAESKAFTKTQALAQGNQSMVQTDDAARSSLSKLGSQMASNRSTLDRGTAAGRQNREAILAVVQAAEAHAAAMVKSKKSVAEASVYTDKFAISLEKSLVKMGMSKSAADAYIKTLLGMPKSASLTVALHDARAQAYLDSIRANMNNLNGTAATVYVNAVASGLPNASQIAHQAGLAEPGRANGGTIGMAAGGTTFAGTVSGPGNAAADLAGRYRLANGEEVTSNLFGQADTFRPVLKAIGSQQVRSMGDLAALLGANRGPVTTKTVNVGGVHMHNPVVVDPVQSAEDASQTITTYAGIL